MKKIILVIVTTFAMSISANAQIENLGVRLFGLDNAGAELSAQWGMGSNRLETDLGWTFGDNFGAIGFTGIWQWKGEIGSGFGWFAGPGVSAGLWFYDGDADDDGGLNVAIAGQVGLEYNFDAIPLQLSVDVRPSFSLIPGTDFHFGGVALGVRYRF